MTNGRLLSCGGYGLKQCYEYERERNRWNQIELTLFNMKATIASGMVAMDDRDFLFHGKFFHVCTLGKSTLQYLNP